MWRGILLVIISATVLFADLFPINAGSQWKFTYSRYEGGWGGGTLDSGFVYWKITKIDSGINGKVITIEQKKEIHRTLIYPMLLEQQLGITTIDSVFSPPKESLSAVTFIGTGNILYNQANSKQIMVHELKNLELYRVDESKAFYKGDSITAVSIFNTYGEIIINDYCVPSGYFRMAQDIGPVSYQYNSSSCVQDYHLQEKWDLIDYKCDNVASIKPSRKHRLSVSGILAGTKILLPLEYQTNDTKIEILQINGKCIWQKRYAGKSLLTIPSNITMHAGCYVIRIVSPKMPALTVQYFVNKY